MPSRARALGRIPAEIGALEENPASERVDDARDGAQRRRLAGAVGAEQRDDLAGVDVEVEVAQHRGPLVSGREPLEREHRLRRHASSAAGRGA